MRSEKEYYRDYEKRFYDAKITAEEGMRGFQDVPPKPIWNYCPKRPRDLRDFTILKLLKFQDGWRAAWCQAAASKCRNIAVTAELNAEYIEKLKEIS